MLTRKTNSPIRNQYAPRGDHLQYAFHIDEGEDEITFPFGPGLWEADQPILNYGIETGNANLTWTYSTAYGTSDAPTWREDDEGKYIKFSEDSADDQYIQMIDNSLSGVDVEFPRGTIIMRFGDMRSFAEYNLLVPLFNSGRAINSSSDVMSLFRSGSSDKIRCALSQDAGLANRRLFEFENTDADLAGNLMLIVTWGEQGFNAWLHNGSTFIDKSLYDGSLLEKDDNLSITNGYRVYDGDTSWIGYNGSRYGGYKFYSFCQWSIQLTQMEIDEIIADPYLPFRPRPTIFFRTDVNPCFGRMQSDKGTFNLVTSPSVGSSGAEQIYTRLSISDDPYLNSNVTEYDFGPYSEPELEIEPEITLPSATGGQKYYWIMEYSENQGYDGWEVFPGGRGKIVTQRQPGDNNFSFAVISDDHLCNSIRNNSTASIASNDSESWEINDKLVGMDIVNNPESIEYQGNAIIGNTKVYACWRAIQDIYEQMEEFDFILFGGDSFMTDSANDVSTLTYDVQGRYRVHRNFLNNIYKFGIQGVALGNHEGEIGFQQVVDVSIDMPLQRESTIARKMYIPLPTNTTYPEGGEYNSTWTPELGTTSLTGTYTYDSTYFDTYVGDGSDGNATPLENYYAFTWGDTLFIFLDPYRYTSIGEYEEDDGSHARTERRWELGTEQKNWFENTLSSATSSRILVFTHQLLAGEPIAISGGATPGGPYYGRGSGANITLPVSGDDSTSTDEEWEMHNMCIRYGVTAVFKGHDHKFAHVINDGIHYFSMPTQSAPSLFSNGWNGDGMTNSYGSAELLGSDKDGVQRYHNHFGWVRVDIGDTMDVTMRQTAFPTDTDFVTYNYDNDRWLGEAYSWSSEDVISLSENPNFVIYATPESEVQVDGWYNNILTNLYPPTSPEDFFLNNSFTIDGSAAVDEDIVVAYVPRNNYEVSVFTNTRAIEGDFNERHNISPDKVVFCYRASDNDSMEVANYYKDARLIPPENLISLPCSSDNLLNEADYISTIRDPLLNAIETLEGNPSSSGERSIWVIILGYHVPHAFVSSSGETIAIASALHRLGKTSTEKMANLTYDRRGDWRYFDVDDASEFYITAVIDGPTKEIAMSLIDRSIAVDGLSFVTGKLYVDPYGLKLTDDQLNYQADILEWVENSMNGLGLQSELTVDIDDPYRDPLVQFFQSDSFYWGWYTPRFSRLLFLNQPQKRVFLYNADEDAAADITQEFDENGSDPWCNIAIGIDPGYASCAGAVDGPDEDAFLRPRPFFESMHRGASLGECFLYSSPYINWKIILIGDPLMVVNFPSEVPPDQDLANESLPNNEVIKRVIVYLEQAIAYATRQYNLLDDTLTAVVDSSNFSEELHLLEPMSNWKDMKGLSARNQLFARPVTGLLNYVLTTEGSTFENWLDVNSERISQLLSDVMDSAEGDAVDADYIYPEGHWNYDFEYTHVRSVLENVQFRLQIAEDEDFTSIVVDANSYDSIDGWQYEAEAFGGFVQMISEGFPSNFSGRRIRYEAVEANYLAQTELYYARWRPLDSNGNNLTGDWFTDNSRMIVTR